MSDLRPLLLRRGPLLLTALLLCALPFYLDAFWLRIGLFSMAAAIGAVGLGLLSGTAGQLSLGHAFFLAVGAYGYVWLAGEPGPHCRPPSPPSSPYSSPERRAGCSAPSPDE
ncbi:hypothetical protein SVIOM342S_03984 [Streptomyces violaceorubidus]